MVSSSHTVPAATRTSSECILEALTFADLRPGIPFAFYEVL